MSTLNNFVISNDQGSLAKFAFLLQAVTDEVIEELTIKDDTTLGLYMERMGEVVAWIGHGDDSRLPADLLLFAEANQRRSLPANRDDVGGDRRDELPADHVIVG